MFLPRIGDRKTDIFGDDEDCPDYEAATGKSESNVTTSGTSYSRSSFDEVRPGHALTASTSTRRSRPLPRNERYNYTYRMVAGGTPLQFVISVDPESGRPAPGKCTFRLAMKANGVEKELGEPTTRMVKVDPRQLEFVVFVFPTKAGPPMNCLWSLRVWLRANAVEHRLFGQDDIWVGKDPDFSSLTEASFARSPINPDPEEQLYQVYIGKALVNFNVKWKHVSNKLYTLSVDYEAGGIGDTLFDDVQLKLDSDPRKITFLIYSIPLKSIPAGSAHKLYVWIRTHVPLVNGDASSTYVLPFNGSFIYQRIWKTDSFKIGSRLEFEAIGNKMVMAFSSGHPETKIVQQLPPVTNGSDILSPRSTFTKEKR